MSIKLANADISALYLGSTAVSAAYLGSTSVFTAGGGGGGSAGSLYGWGVNNMYQLGTGSLGTVSTPTQIGSSQWSDVSGFWEHSLGISNAGLYAWGTDNDGTLGGVGFNAATPTQIGSDNWSKVAAGQTHSLAIDAAGNLFAWGSNAYGQLGDGTTTNRATPTQIGSDTWSAIAAGTQHSCGIKSNGTLWNWGPGTKLGSGNSDSTSPVQVGSDTWSEIKISKGGAFTVGITSGGALYCWGYFVYGLTGDTNTYLAEAFSPQLVDSGPWLTASAGTNHIVAIKTNGDLYAWGLGSSGQLGNGGTSASYDISQIGSAQWSDVSCGATHTIAIASDSTLYGWGNNSTSQLGDGTTTNRLSPTQIDSGTWLSVAAGQNYSLAIKQ